jgi:glutathione synthase
MRIFVFVNRLSEVGPRQTTAMLVATCLRRGCEVLLAEPDGLSIATLAGAAVTPSVQAVCCPTDCHSAERVAKFAKTPGRRQSFPVVDGDLILIRTNPGRDTSRLVLHDALLDSLRILETGQIRVINSPVHLSFFATKASLSLLDPQFRPSMLVTHLPNEAQRFIAEAPGDCIMKPAKGSRGQDVVRVQREDPHLEAVLEQAFATGQMILQHFVAADHTGDRRVIVLDGRMLEHNGRLAGIERRPAAGDFRGNLHAGGTAHPLTLNESARAATQHAAELLHSQGIRLAGVDLIGDKIIELNVFSTGGLYDGSRFANVDFTDPIITSLLQV